jgi:hypothetical protein
LDHSSRRALELLLAFYMRSTSGIRRIFDGHHTHPMHFITLPLLLLFLFSLPDRLPLVVVKSWCWHLPLSSHVFLFLLFCFIEFDAQGFGYRKGRERGKRKKEVRKGREGKGREG